MKKSGMFVYLFGERSAERDTYRGNTIVGDVCELYTSDVLEHKWRASLKTILFYMNDFDF